MNLTSASQPLTFLVLDLETSGLDEHADRIIEVAAVGLSADIATELFSVNEVVQADSTARARLAAAPQAVIDMHEANGLMADIDRPDLPSLAEVEATMLDLIEKHAPNGADVYLSGSGVSHFDHRFLTQHMPRLADRLHYAIADVGIMRRVYRQVTGGHLCDANSKKTHRAMDDVRCHIEELRAFRDVFTAHASSVRPGLEETA